MNFIDKRRQLFQKMNDKDAMDVEDIENGEASIYCEMPECAGLAVEEADGKQVCSEHWIAYVEFVKTIEDSNLRK